MEDIVEINFESWFFTISTMSLAILIPILICTFLRDIFNSLWNFDYFGKKDLPKIPAEIEYLLKDPNEIFENSSILRKQNLQILQKKREEDLQKNIEKMKNNLAKNYKLWDELNDLKNILNLKNQILNESFQALNSTNHSEQVKNPQRNENFKKQIHHHPKHLLKSKLQKRKPVQKTEITKFLKNNKEVKNSISGEDEWPVISQISTEATLSSTEIMPPREMNQTMSFGEFGRISTNEEFEKCKFPKSPRQNVLQKRRNLPAKKTTLPSRSRTPKSNERRSHQTKIRIHEKENTVNKPPPFLKIQTNHNETGEGADDLLIDVESVKRPIYKRLGSNLPSKSKTPQSPRRTLPPSPPRSFHSHLSSFPLESDIENFQNNTFESSRVNTIADLC